MKTIGLIAAMQQEIRPLTKLAVRWEAVRVSTFPAFHFRLNDKDCMLVRSGVGHQHAADAAHALFQAVRPEILISYGIAGAVDSGLRIGDIVAGKRSCLLEDGVPKKDLHLEQLSTIEFRAIADALEPHGASLVSGTIITTSGAQPVQDKTKELPHPVAEMETYGIAEVATEHGIPLLALRSISDNPEEPIPLSIEELYDAEYHLRTGWLIRTILRRPTLLPALLRLARNSDIATKNAAWAVMAYLNHSSSDISGEGYQSLSPTIR